MVKSRDELNTLINSWPEDTKGFLQDDCAICILDALGHQIGYGALEQLAHWLRQIQCDQVLKDAANLKRERFKELGWKLPDDFEEVASK